MQKKTIGQCLLMTSNPLQNDTTFQTVFSERILTLQIKKVMEMFQKCVCMQIAIY